MKLRYAGRHDAPDAKFLPILDANLGEALVLRQKPNSVFGVPQSLHREGTIETGNNYITRFGRFRLVHNQKITVLDGGTLSVHTVASCPHKEGRRAVLNEQFVQVQFALQMIVSRRRKACLDSG